MPAKEWEVVGDAGDSYHEEGARRFNVLQRLRWLATLLDSQFRFLGVRIGWDPIAGLIPGVGDLATNLAGFYILIEASNLGAPPSVILRMGLNLIVDNLLDAVPFFGSFFDIFWRANVKNVALLERYLENPRRTVVHSRGVLILTLGGVLLASFASVVLAVMLAVFLFRELSAGW